MTPERFPNDSGMTPERFRPSRARADQGTGSRDGSREISHLAIPTYERHGEARRELP